MPSLEELVSSEESSPRPFPWGRVAIVAGLMAVLSMAIFLPPLINLGKYRHSITASMSEALGRPVYVGGMQLRLLPTPGIVMTDFTVDEDPAFGSEPALHANSVVASLRLTSLWRGRLEVSRISLDEANLNLVHNSAGQWSIGPVLLRASQIPNAPTAERHAGAHPRFPYIEATDSRIDFKDGVEKKPFSLMNAEFSMWQAGSDEWRLRLRAQPVRTDLQLHLSDTGRLEVEGSLRRASVLDAMPVDLRAEWSGAQLGQVSRLVAGMDSGWRGDLDATATLRGSLGDLQTQSRLRIGNLRRQEFQPVSPMDIDATCRSEYRREAHVFDNITCFWPLGDGHLLLTGSVRGWESPSADLQLEINQTPASFPAQFLGLMRPGAQNVTVTGNVNGSFHLVTGARGGISGEATATGVSLRYPGGTVALPPMHFLAPPPAPPAPHRAKHPPPPVPLQYAVQLPPVSVPLGQPEPVIADAQFTRTGFDLHLNGQATLARLLPVAANFGLLENAVALVAPKGRATLNLSTTGGWVRPLSGPSPGLTTTGVLKLEAVQLRPAFLPSPVDVDAAEVDLTSEGISWRNVALAWQKMNLRGSIAFPAGCEQPLVCPAIFALTADSLSAASIETALGIPANSGFFSQLLNNTFGGGHLSPWPSLRGQIHCGALDLGPLPLHNVSATLGVESGKLTLSTVDASMLGGTLHGSGAMEIRDNTPHWKLDLAATGVNAGDVATLFGERWASTGKMSGEANLTLTGYRAPDLVSSAAGDFSFAWQKGALAGLRQAADSPLARFDRWTGKGTIGNKALTFTTGGISQGARTIPLRGTVSFSRGLDLTLQTRRGATRVSGTLARPVIAPATAP